MPGTSYVHVTREFGGRIDHFSQIYKKELVLTVRSRHEFSPHSVVCISPALVQIVFSLCKLHHTDGTWNQVLNIFTVAQKHLQRRG